MIGMILGGALVALGIARVAEALFAPREAEVFWGAFVGTITVIVGAIVLGGAKTLLN
jgi:uncharacterized membrane protein HdeD (DUF308 family)